MATPLEEGDVFDPKKESELYASLYPHAGVAVNPDTGEAIKPEQQGLLDQSREEEGEEEREWYEPLDQFPAYGAGLLAAGASMMRQSGWRHTPITTDEMIGHAIPAGMEAYYNQKIMNRQDDALDQQQQAAIAAAEKERDDAESEEEDKAAFIKYLKASGLSEDWVQLYSGMYNTDPKGTWTKLQAHVKGDKTAEGKAETKAEQRKRFIKGLKAADVKPARYNNFLGMFDVKPETAFEKLDALLSEKNKPADKKDRYDSIPKSDLASHPQYAHMDKYVPEGGALKVTDKGDLIPMDATYKEVHAKKDKEERLPGKEPYIIKIKPVEINGVREEFNVWADPVLGLYPLGHEKAFDKDGKRQLDPSKFWETAKSITYQDKKPPKGDYGTGGDGLPEEVDTFLSGRNITVPTDATSVNIDDNQNVTFQTPDGEEPAFWTKDQLASKYPTLKKKLQGLPDDAIYRLVKDAQGNLDPVQVFKEDAPKTITKTILNDVTGYFEEIEYLIGKNGRIDLSSANIIGASNVHTDQKRIYRKFNIEKGRYENIERNLRTEKEINLGPASAKHLIPHEHVQAEVEKKRIDLLTEQFPALLEELKKDYGVGDTEINRLRKEGKRNIDSAWHEATAHITDLKPYEFYGDVKRGSELNEIINITGSEGIARRKVYDLKTGQKLFNPKLLYRLTKDGEWVDMSHAKNKQLFSDETSLRKEYNLITKDVRVAGQAYMGLLTGAADNTGVGDIMIITSFRRMFEPDSVVREGEFAITEDAQGAWNKFINTPEKFMDGHRLKPKTRQMFVKLAIDYMAGLNEYFGSQRDRYRELADDYKMRNINTLIHDPLKGLPLTERQRIDFELNPKGFMKEHGSPTFTGKRYTDATDEEVAAELDAIINMGQLDTTSSVIPNPRPNR